MDDITDALAGLIRDHREGYYQQVNEWAAAGAITDYLAANRNDVLVALDGERQHPPWREAGETWHFPADRGGQ